MAAWHLSTDTASGILDRPLAIHFAAFAWMERAVHCVRHVTLCGARSTLRAV